MFYSNTSDCTKRGYIVLSFSGNLGDDSLVDLSDCDCGRWLVESIRLQDDCQVPGYAATTTLQHNTGNAIIK